MPRLELTLRVDAPPAAQDGSTDFLGEESQRVRKQVYAALRLKPHSVAWITLRLGTPKAGHAIAFLTEERRKGGAIVGAAHLHEILEEDEEPDSDWSLLHTRQVDSSFSLWDDYPQCRAGTLRGHAVNHTFVSSPFVACCRQAGLQGIDFLRCRDSGRKPGEPWFAALPAHFLGRGLDHPWFDRAPWAAHVADDHRKRASAIDIGQNAFHQSWLKRSHAERDPLLKTLLELCPTPAVPSSGLFGLKLQMVPRFLRAALPDADFAYFPWGEDGPNREGKLLRLRLLAVRRRARQALTRAGLLEDRDFLRVRSVAQAEPGVETLDARPDPPEPMYPAAELRLLRERERTL